jgi:DNA-binding protein YbaB
MNDKERLLSIKEKVRLNNQYNKQGYTSKILQEYDVEWLIEQTEKYLDVKEHLIDDSVNQLIQIESLKKQLQQAQEKIEQQQQEIEWLQQQVEYWKKQADYQHERKHINAETIREIEKQLQQTQEKIKRIKECISEKQYMTERYDYVVSVEDLEQALEGEINE